MIRSLIADDEKAVASIIIHFINKHNLPIEIVGVAENGASTISMIKDKKPQLVFLDIQMPINNGFDVMRAMPDINYLIITAYESFHYAQQALRLGAKDIILKPIEYQSFIQSVERVLGWNFTSNHTVNKIIEYINIHYAEEIGLNQLSNMFYTTPSHISRLFKQYMNTSVLAYIHKIRINKAIELIIDNNYCIKDAAMLTGYNSLNNFYKYFKLNTGMTPATYKTKLSK